MSTAIAIRVTTCCLALAAAHQVRAQAFNVDFGPPGSTPSSAYAAAGVPGVWNSIGLLDPWVRSPLVDVNGVATGAQIYMYGCDDLYSFDDPLTTGDHASLIDDMLISFNSPVDACVWVEGLPNGLYEVLIYALTPGNASQTHRVRVDNAAQGPIWIGGAWPGAHQLDLTYARHTVAIAGGVIGLHSGLYGASITSGINGIQVRRIDGCYPDCNASGSLTIADFACFQQKFAAQDLYADCNASGTLTIADFACFQAAFAQGCP